jgi:hypothetical protein
VTKIRAAAQDSGRRPGRRWGSGSPLAAALVGQGVEDVIAPFPDVADGLPQAVAIGFVAADRGVMSQPSSTVLAVGKLPCQILHRQRPSVMSNSSPQG